MGYCKLRLLISSLVLISTAVFSIANACTGIQLKNQDGSIVHGRTLEFGVQIATDVVVVPRNYQFSGTLPDGSPGLTYRTKYAAVGGTLHGEKFIADGLNEAGLAVGAFYFPDYAGYAAVTPDNKSHMLAPLEFQNWILTQFATIDEVKQGLNTVAIAPTAFKAWGFVPPLHYIVYDKTGKSIVIEPINGQLIAHDNPLGVLTNSPSFGWHMTNLRNYINLSPLNVPKVAVNGMTLQQLGQGGGMHGLPGDFTPPSRFVRAAIFSVTATPAVNAEKGILQVLHILNQFDIPVGAVKSLDNGVIQTDFTMLTVARDPQNLRYYTRTYDDQNIKMVSLKAFDLNAKEIKALHLHGGQPIGDVSANLK